MMVVVGMVSSEEDGAEALVWALPDISLGVRSEDGVWSKGESISMGDEEFR